MAIGPALVAEVAAWAEAWLGQRQRTLRLPGVQYAIAHRGSIVASGAHGQADLSTGEDLTSSHLFRIASHSKTFTATALLRLSERSGLRLDDRLRDHLDWVAGDGWEAYGSLTLRELLQHGGGISRDGADGDHWQLRRPFPDADGLRDLLAGSTAPFPANDRFHYSNLAYSLLGLVIESVTGRPYAEQLRSEIVEPLGLRNTEPDHAVERAAEYAAGHTHGDDGRRRLPIDHVPTNAMAPATGLTSTAEDLCRFFGTLCFGDERLLSDAAKRRMQQRQWTQREHEHYGLGLQILDLGERSLIGHAGGYPGHSTKTWCDPHEGLVVSVLVNAISAPAAELCTEVFRLLDQVAQARDEAIPAHAAAVDLRSFEGRFVNLWGSYDVAAFGDRLLVVPAADNPADGLAELTVETPATARLSRAPDGYTSEGELFHFDRDAGGRIVRVRGPSALSAYPADEYEREFLSEPRLRLQE